MTKQLYTTPNLVAYGDVVALTQKPGKGKGAKKGKKKGWKKHGHGPLPGS